MAYEAIQAKALVVESGIRLMDSGLIVRTWGNISARVSDTEFAITPSGRAYESLTPEDIVTVRIDDLSYEGTDKPSSEKALHAAIYRQREDVNFIVHTHQPYASALSVLGINLRVDRMNQEAAKAVGAVVPTARYGLSATQKLADRVEEKVIEYPDCKAVLMCGHGAVVLGTDEEDAFNAAHVLENVSARAYRKISGVLLPKEAWRRYEDREFYRVLHRDVQDEYDEHYEVFENPAINCIIETTTPFVMKMSEYGKNMKICIDDLAQIAGLSVRCLPADASEDKIKKALGSANGAVLIQGKGAICTGTDEEEAEAVCMVLEKGAMAALLGKTRRYIHTIPPVSSIAEHLFYIKKYAKRK